MPRESRSPADAAPRSRRVCIPLKSFLRTHWIITESSGTTLEVVTCGEIVDPPIILDNQTHIPGVRSIARDMNDMVIWWFESILSSSVGLLGPFLTLNTICPGSLKQRRKKVVHILVATVQHSLNGIEYSSWFVRAFEALSVLAEYGLASR